MSPDGIHEHDRHLLGEAAATALAQENGGRTDVPWFRADVLRWRVATVARRARDARDEAYRQRHVLDHTTEVPS